MWLGSVGVQYFCTVCVLQYAVRVVSLSKYVQYVQYAVLRSSILVCAVCNMYSIAIVFVVSLCRMYSMYPVLCSIWLVVTAGGHVVPTERQNSLSDVSLAATCSNWAPKWPRHITAGWTRYTDRPIPNSIPLPLVMTKYTH